jgi:hypothetical protein
MKSLLASTILALIFFVSGISVEKAPAIAETESGMTIIAKNQVWPIQPDLLFTNCEVNKCVEI